MVKSEPRYVVGDLPGFSEPSSMLIQVHRMDGKPAKNRFGKPYAHASSIGLEEALLRIEAMIRALPQLPR